MPQRKRTSELARNKPLDINRLPSWVADPEKVLEGDIDQIIDLVGTRTEMNKRHGKDNWGREEVSVFIVENRKGKISATWYDQHREMEMDQAHAKLVEDRTNQYLKHFTNVTPNDMIGITEMARIELALGLVDQKLRRLGEKPVADISSNDIKTLAEVKSTLTKNLQSLEKSLGIDRASREQESDVYVIVERVKRQARELIEKRRRELYCANCAKADIKTYLGFLMFHYDANDVPFEFKTLCPKCGEPVVVVNHPIILNRSNGNTPTN